MTNNLWRQYVPPVSSDEVTLYVDNLNEDDCSDELRIIMFFIEKKHILLAASLHMTPEN